MDFLWRLICLCGLSASGFHNVYGHPRGRNETFPVVPVSHSSKNSEDRDQVTSKPSVGNFGCFPNILDKPVPSNKLKKLGFSYGYKTNSLPDQPKSYNVWTNTSFVENGLVYLPDTMIPAIHVLQYTHTTFKINETIICDLQDTNVLSRYDGVDHFVSFDSDSMDVPHSGVMYHLHEDPKISRGFEIIYTCYAPNYTTGICELVIVQINTRVRPDKLTSREKQLIDQASDRVLRRYCFSIEDMVETVFDDDLDACTGEPYPAFLALVQGYRESLPQREPAPTSTSSTTMYPKTR